MTLLDEMREERETRGRDADVLSLSVGGEVSCDRERERWSETKSGPDDLGSWFLSRETGKRARDTRLPLLYLHYLAFPLTLVDCENECEGE